MHTRQLRPTIAALALFAAPLPAAADDVFGIDTYLAMTSASEIAVSPDGAFVAYTLSRYDLEDDTSQSAVWMIPLDGGDAVRMTSAVSGAGTPRWSPDNRYLAVLSDRVDDTTQVWLLDRRGGDAQQLTDFPQGVEDYGWSPDGSRMWLVVEDATPADLDEEEPPHPRPWVIDRLQFKEDYVGYLDRYRTHVHVIELDSRETRQVTHGDFDDSDPVWSPDGKAIVFVSNRTEYPDRNRNTDLWRIDVDEADARPEQLTSADYADARPAFSPDGRFIAYTSAISDGLPIYAIPQLTILDLESGESQRVESLADIQVLSPAFSSDSRSVYVITEYRGEQQLVRVDLETGAALPLIEREDAMREFGLAPDGRPVALIARPQWPSEIFVLEDDGLRKLSALHDALLADVTTGAVEKHTYSSDDGTAIDAFIVFPPEYRKGRRYPAVLHLHGGPQAQWDYGFDAESQLLAARGYVVIMPNPRGSWGYGTAFGEAIRGDWGGIDTVDVLAAVDFAIDKGWADEDRLAVYGWSYGGMLTNHVITKTDRFKAAITGASATLYVTNYGHDMYQRWWEEELGLPWLEENRDAWQRISPFYALDKVTTPTLIVGGEKDWNVPIINSEQLYIALKRRGIPTSLVVYPGEYHSLSVPSYERDLYERYFAWLDKYVD